jgi:dTDP-4-dehydrorhamnose reductase
MIKETTILTGLDKAYDSVDAFFTENGLDEWRAKELKCFTDAGFDITDSAKQQVALSEDGTKVIITVAYVDQAEKDAILALAENATAPDVLPLVEELVTDHLF